MRIAFVDFINWDYKIETVYDRPLGGSHSALCYLAAELAKQGHEVFLLNNTKEPGMSLGVNCLRLDSIPYQLLHSFDALIVLNLAGWGMQNKALFSDRTRLVLWTGHTPDQPAMEALRDPAERDLYDGIVFVSEWQRDRYHQYFNIDRDRSMVLRNAISPFFSELFADRDPILSHKFQPPVLAYTSSPYRGLDILLEVFPEIRKAVPGIKLKVFSSMKVYQVSESEDESNYGSLYDRCRQTEGVEYIGSLPQQQLASELRSVMLFAYPNHYAETSCIAMLEAMASGCRIISSNLGALPETAAGFASLIPIDDNSKPNKDYFIHETIRVLKECYTADTEAFLKQQVSYINRHYSWSVRAKEWVEWLNSIIPEQTGSLSDILLETSASFGSLQQQAYQYFMQCEYSQAQDFYEQIIEAFPTIMSNYWYLGLSLLLQGKEMEAQSIWALATMDGSPEQVDVWTAELMQVLQIEIERQKEMKNYQMAELIQQYLS